MFETNILRMLVHWVHRIDFEKHCLRGLNLTNLQLFFKVNSLTSKFFIILEIVPVTGCQVSFFSGGR